MRMIRPSKLALAVGATFVAVSALAATKLVLVWTQTPPVNVSSIPEQVSNKARMVRLPDGTLVVFYLESFKAPDGAKVFDLPARAFRDPNEVLYQVSRDQGTTWTRSINLSGSTQLWSKQVNLDGDAATPAVPYYGDNDKPTVVNVGDNILVTWRSRYCGDGASGEAALQKTVTYTELTPTVEVPYFCMMAARMAWNASTATLSLIDKQRITTGERDAAQDMNAGSQNGFAIAWQEDPAGTRLGDAEGPGDGGTGASVSGGTEAWYSYISVGSGQSYGRTYAWPVTAISANAGTARGASRVNVALAAQQAVMAYEESKGLSALRGKYIRYHAFTMSAPPAPAAGCIISDPLENARRVRMLTQGASAGSTNVVFLYRQGLGDQGAPADVMMRRAVGGFTPDKIAGVPVADCTVTPTTVDEVSALAAKYTAAAPNLSSVSGVTATTSADAKENALAMRGVLRGSDLLVGYIYTSDSAAYLNPATAANYNYNLYIRRSSDGGATFGAAENVTNYAPSSKLTVREPRTVGAPGSGPTCSTDPTECQNGSAVYLAWGTQTDWWLPSGPKDVDIFVRASLDKGVTWTDTVAMSTGNVVLGVDDSSEDSEAQLRLRPDGRRMFGVFNAQAPNVSDVFFRSASVQEVTVPDPVTPTPPPPVIPVSSGGGGGCTVGGEGAADLGLAGLLVAAFAGLLRRRRALR